MAGYATPYGKIMRDKGLERRSFISKRTEVIYPKLSNYRDSDILDEKNDNLKKRV